MLPGTTRPIHLPPNYSPPNPGYLDVNLASHLLMIGRVEHVSAQRIRELNRHIQELETVVVWNGCNGLQIDAGAELSLDATPLSHHFVNKVVPKPPARRRPVSVKRYFEEKYKIHLNYCNSPLLRDSSGSMFPIETVWFRIRVR